MDKLTMVLKGQKEIIREYFKDLHRQEKVDLTKIEEYLREGTVHRIAVDKREILNREITMNELNEAIQKQKSNKTPGLDEFPSEFYKNVGGVLKKMFLEVCKDVPLKAKIPNTWKEAYITLIPKEESNTNQVKSFRPISLLNTDYKIFMTIMAQRLKGILSKEINMDQNGFLPRRQIRDNIRTVIDLLEYYESHPGDQMALIFLDAQKAFDNLNWDFMKVQINKMNFGSNFEKMLNVIYDSQRANVLINGETTKVFKIEKGVRQGCPLSPLLFITILETLLDRIRGNRNIKGTKIRGQEYKLQAFADDMVFVIEEPMETGPILLQEINEFGKLAGLKINKGKTKMLVKNMTNNKQKKLEETMGLQIVNKIKYLGIWIREKTIMLWEDNYIKILKQLKKTWIIRIRCKYHCWEE
uniref:Reverse transcriptase domain-containing protein n=1 Tax=Naja naja TaxID=35670 RepID=A0A8C6XLH0_NAJNA